MKKKYVHALGLWAGLLIANLGIAQSVGVNTTGATPNASTILDLNTGNTFTSPNGKGLLIPNVALTGTGDATTVTSPATSLMVYNTATAGAGVTAVIPGYYYWDGTKWVQFQSSSNASQDWKLTGNSGTTAGTNFVGTTDAVDFVTKTNNAERMRVTSGGNVGIGTSAPSASLSIVATATNTGFQLKDGSEGAGKVLTSDANGKASWVTKTSAIMGVQTSTSTVAHGAGITYLNWQITLPAGKWAVNIGLLVQNLSLQPNSYYAPRFTLSESASTSGIVAVNFSTIGSDCVIRPTYTSNSYTDVWSIPYQNLGLASGTILINVTSPTTLYLHSSSPLAFGTGTATTDFGTGLYSGNYLYATPFIY